MFGARQALWAGTVALLAAVTPGGVGAKAEDLTLDVNSTSPGCGPPRDHPALGGALVSYYQAPDQTQIDETQHIFFVDGSAHIHHLRFEHSPLGGGNYSGHWDECDLTATARPPGIAATPESPMAAYVQSSNNSQHVNFIDTKGHLRDLRYDSKYKYWAPFDLTLIGCSVLKTADAAESPVIKVALTNPGTTTATNPGSTCNSVPSPLPGSPIDAYWQPSDDSQHVNFIDVNGDVHELFQSPNQSWLDTDLTYFAHIHDTPLGSTTRPAVNPAALHGYWDSNNTEHVNFIDANGDVHELLWDGNSWSANDLSDNDLTSLARSRSVASPSTALTGYLENDSQHVNFVGEDGHVHELLKHPGQQWVDNDLTVNGNERLIGAGSLGGVRPDGLIGYWEKDDNSQHIYFITTDDHVHHLHWNGSDWADEDLTYLDASCTQNNLHLAVPGALSAYKPAFEKYESVIFTGKTPATNSTPGAVDVFRFYAQSGGSECSPPTVNFSANPALIRAGQSSTLSWTSSNAYACTGVDFTPSGASGSTTVRPSATTPYWITCWGRGGSATASTTVTVTASPPPPPPPHCPGGAGCMCGLGGACNAGLTCVQGTCVSCGGYSHICCQPNNTCSGNLTCQPEPPPGTSSICL